MIVLQTQLPARRLVDVYTVPPVQGNAVYVDLMICNQSTAHWAELDVVVSHPARKPDIQVWEAGETNPTMVAPAEYYVHRNKQIEPTEDIEVSLKLHTGETVRLKASTANVTVTVMSEEFVTPDALHAIEERVDVLVEDVLRLQKEAEDAGR